MKRVGLFIGINAYQHNIQALRCARNDAQKLGTCFARKQFDEVEYLLDGDAVSAGIIDSVVSMTSRLSPGDLFVLYFAGHGREDLNGVHNLVGYDGFSDPRIPQGSIPVSGLLAASDVPGVNRLFILDCCRVDLLAGRGEAYACPGSRDLSLKKACSEAARALPPFILSSCSTGEQAFELPNEKRGVFTLALQKVLEDKADPVRDFSSLLVRVDQKMEQLCPPGTTQTLDQSCNLRKWSGVPLFSEWEGAAPSPAPADVSRPVPAPEPRESADELFRRGKEYFDRKDFANAVNYYRQAAEQGLAEAQFNLGACYDYGEGVPQDYGKAVEWYQKAADQNHAEAQNQLGLCYIYGYGVPQDYGKAIEWYQKAVDQGNAGAQNNLAFCYENDRGVPQDLTKAVELYRKAAEQGNVSAQNNLGACYYNGNGVPQNYGKAVEWLAKAAEQGLAEAQCALGNCYYNGNGVTQDYETAAAWFRKAAEQGLAQAQCALGECYEYGNGVPPDYGRAVQWYQKAADQGNAGGQSGLGMCYIFGRGVTQDYNKAVEWLAKAVDQNHAPAQFVLGWCYEYGNGVLKDLRKARVWYQKAADQGNENAREALKRLG